MLNRLILLLFCLSISYFSNAQKMYFGHQSLAGIYSLDLTTNNFATLHDDQPVSRRIKVDRKNKKVYWVVGLEGRIMRSDLDGNNLETIHQSNFGLNMLQFDEEIKFVYFTRSDGEAIRRLSLDSGDITIVVPNTDFVQGIDIDTANQKLYWTEFNQREIYKSNLDGSNIELVHETVGKPLDLLINASEQKIYYTERETNQINTIGLDGTNPEVLLELDAAPGVISIDQEHQLLYWVEGGELIKRADLQGGNVEVVAASFEGFSGMDLDFELTTSSQDITQATNIKVFPNPSNGILNIETQEEIKSIKLFSINGIEVTNKVEVNEQFSILNLSQLPAGNYLLQLNTEEQQFAKPIIHH